MGGVEVHRFISVLIQECHNLYTDTEHGLVDIASSLGLSLLPPRKKITIMLIGEWVMVSS